MTAVEISPRVREVALWVTAVPAVVALLLAAGWFLPERPFVAVALGAVVLAIGLSLVEPAALPLLAMPGMLVVARADLGGVDLSFSDLILAVAFWPAVLLAPRPYSPPMRTLLWFSAAYQASTLFTVIANPALANTVEWFHAWLLVAGALVVGWAVGRRGFARAGLTLLLLTGGLLALVTIGQGVLQFAGGNFSPVYPSWPYGMHKNFVGTALGFVAVIAYARPVWLGWSKRWAMALFWASVAGVILAQSRQALVGIGLGLLVIALRRDPHRRRSKLIVFALVPAVLFVASLIQEDIESGRHNSLAQRATFLADAWHVWLENPWAGVGLRWWIGAETAQPPNAELEVLTSAGVVGLAGFLLLMLGGLIVLWRLDPTYGTLAFSILLVRLTQAQFDLFWSAVQVSVPFVVAGICLGAQQWAVERERLESALVRAAT
ncbi:O-antigen ligase family protein [Georgenia sp. M64]|uniref:O-antigen ligase family protein n=1 Tax=Georgenia sp. M64 TaxID=3120520 RepID=UPI0030E2F1CE